MTMNQYGQLSLFDSIDIPDIPDEHIETDMCLVYLVTMKGGNSGNVFVLHKDDAIKFCSDPCSHGMGRGGAWMFQWTSLEHFRRDDMGADQHKNVHGKLEPFVFIQDTGAQDDDLERLGINKPDIAEIEEVLTDMGYAIEYKGARTW